MQRNSPGDASTTRRPPRPRHGEANPVLNALSNDITTLRADDDQIELAEAHASLRPKAIERLSVHAARAQPTVADAVLEVLRRQGKSTMPADMVPGIRSVDTMLDGAAGPLPARIYTPAGTGPFPVVVYFHGGGWVIADKQVYDAGARGIAKQAQAIVVSVDYRRAPEHKFPAAWDDALAAYRWVLAHAASFGGDPARVALAGESAGGNLAVATAIAARDTHLQPPLHVLSIYPLAQTSLNTESHLENVIAKPLNRAMIAWFVDKLIRSRDDLKDPRLSLVDADLGGLPPVTLINARLDPLSGDGAKLEDALRAAAVPVECRTYDCVAHEFFGAAAVLHKAREAHAFAGSRLREAFDTGD